MYQIKNKYITSNLTVSKSIEIANNKKIGTEEAGRSALSAD